MVIRRVIKENEFSGIFRKKYLREKELDLFFNKLLTLATSCCEMIKDLTFSPDYSFAFFHKK